MAGTVYFRQVEGEDVQIWGKFYWTRDQPTTMAHNWHIHENAVSCVVLCWGCVGLAGDICAAVRVGGKSIVEGFGPSTRSVGE